MKDPRESMNEAFAASIEEGVDLLVAVSDSTSTAKIAPFAGKYPERIVNVGIAEQNLMGMAAGMSLGGYTVVTANAAPFLVNRSAEQVRNDVAYTGTNVKMMGLNPGFAYGSLGATHHAIGDIAMMRRLGGVRIYTPADPKGTGEAVRHALENDGPAYVRVDSGTFADLPRPNGDFPPDRPIPVTDGNDITILALGTAAHAAKEAAVLLQSRGISADTWAVTSIRPLETGDILESMKKTGKVVTVEAHSVGGGLGSLVSELIAEEGIPARLRRLGVPEGKFAPASPRPAIEKLFYLDAAGIAAAAGRLMENG